VGGSFMLDLIAEKWIVDSGVELEEGFRLWVSGRGGRGGGEGVRGGEGRGGEMRGGEGGLDGFVFSGRVGT